MTISASRSDCRNSSGPSKSRMRMRAEPSPWATWESEPGAGDDAVLGGEAHGLLVEGADRHARVEDLDRVDVVEDRRAGARSRGPSACGRTGADVDQPALALDLGDRLLQRQPARDLLLDEQPDHLALAGGLDLLADDHLDAGRRRPARAPRARRRSRCGRSPRSPRGPVRVRRREQHLDGRRAVVRVVGVHVQVDVDQRPLRERARAAAASPSRGVAPRGELAVDAARSVGGRAVVVGDQLGSRRGSSGPSARPSPAVLAVRASRRPKKLSTKRRASSVESSRSLEEWKEPTFSAREWRSAALDVLGANGSCTCTKSSSTVPSSSSTVRATSIGSDGGAPARAGRDVEHLADGDHARRRRRRCPRAGSAAAPRAARSALRDSRTRSCERDGASTSTRCPRRRARRRRARTCALTSLSCASHGYGRDVGDRERRASAHDYAARAAHAPRGLASRAGALTACALARARRLGRARACVALAASPRRTWR